MIKNRTFFAIYMPFMYLLLQFLTEFISRDPVYSADFCFLPNTKDATSYAGVWCLCEHVTHESPVFGICRNWGSTCIRLILAASLALSPSHNSILDIFCPQLLAFFFFMKTCIVGTHYRGNSSGIIVFISPYKKKTYVVGTH